jgi:hypothetical protein
MNNIVSLMPSNFKELMLALHGKKLTISSFYDISRLAEEFVFADRLIVPQTLINYFGLKNFDNFIINMDMSEKAEDIMNDFANSIKKNKNDKCAIKNLCQNIALNSELMKHSNFLISQSKDYEQYDKYEKDTLNSVLKDYQFENIIFSPSYNYILTKKRDYQKYYSQLRKAYYKEINIQSKYYIDKSNKYMLFDDLIYIPPVLAICLNRLKNSNKTKQCFDSNKFFSILMEMRKEYQEIRSLMSKKEKAYKDPSLSMNKMYEFITYIDNELELIRQRINIKNEIPSITSRILNISKKILIENDSYLNKILKTNKIFKEQLTLYKSKKYLDLYSNFIHIDGYNNLLNSFFEDIDIKKNDLEHLNNLVFN